MKTPRSSCAARFRNQEPSRLDCEYLCRTMQGVVVPIPLFIETIAKQMKCHSARKLNTKIISWACFCYDDHTLSY